MIWYDFLFSLKNQFAYTVCYQCYKIINQQSVLQLSLSLNPELDLDNLTLIKVIKIFFFQTFSNKVL